MRGKRKIRAYIDGEGRLVLPPGEADLFGLTPGSQVCIDVGEETLHLHRPISRLAKVYIEPTNRCNLDCRTCIRNVWDESLGFMKGSVFEGIVDGLRTISPVPSVFFGGLGEPLTHPKILEMVSRAKSTGAFVELITNGTLLTGKMAEGLIEAGIDMLWVSLDGATPDHYQDVRLGAEFGNVLSNLSRFCEARRSFHLVKNRRSGYPEPALGIVFVAMKRNVGELPAILRLANQFGASRVMVTNVLPYTADMCREALYSKALMDSSSVPQLELPRIDMSRLTRLPLYEATQSGFTIIHPEDDRQMNDRCPFIRKGATAISWDGYVSPCLPLLHSYRSYIDEREHFRRRHRIGGLAESSLAGIWHSPDYVRFRESLEQFDFSPCTYCGGCELSETNESDCTGHLFPTCGGCLWARGLVQCP